MAALSLTQEFFLCTIGEKGKYSSFDMEKGACLVTAGVLELLMNDIAVLEDKKMALRAPLPAANAYLSSLYDFIEKKQPVKMERIVENYSFTFTDKNLVQLIDAVGDSLVPLDCAQREAGGLFGTRARYLPAAEKRDHVIQKIRAEFLEDGELSDDIVALTALLHKSGGLSKYFSAYEKKDLKKRLQEITASSENQVVTKMMDYLESLFAVIVIVAAN